MAANMLSTYKKVRNWQSARGKDKAPVLSQTDEDFLERIVTEANATKADAPPSSSAQASPSSTEIKASEAVATSVEADKKKANRLSFLQRVGTKRKPHKPHKGDGLDPDPAIEPVEAGKEEQDIQRALESLNLAAKNNKTFALSPASQELVQKFTLVLKDLINGVPTAYDDLVHLLDNSQAQLQKSFGQLPPFLQKLVQSLPTKLTGSLGPELLAAATEAQGVTAAEAGGGGLAGLAAKAAGRIPSLKDIVTKPGAVVGLLKTIMNALKLRWPAFLGTNVLLSLALFVLLFVFWYCHKRGREERLKKEKGAADALASEGRIEELQDDPMLEGPSTSSAPPARASEPVTAPPTSTAPPPVTSVPQ